MGKRIKEKDNLVTLYKKFKLNQSHSIKKEDILAKGFQQDNSFQKAKKLKEYIENRIPIIIVVSSLYAKSGCTYICKTFADYLESLNYSVLLAKGDEYKAVENNNYNFIIIDAGKYDKIPKVMDRTVLQAQIKIMVCIPSDIFFKDLSRFIKTGINSEQWKFFFNMVPKGEYRRISNLMEEYEYYIAPTISIGDLIGEK